MILDVEQERLRSGIGFIENPNFAILAENPLSVGQSGLRNDPDRIFETQGRIHVGDAVTGVCDVRREVAVQVATDRLPRGKACLSNGLFDCEDPKENGGWNKSQSRDGE
jgi:hypothetical protein